MSNKLESAIQDARQLMRQQHSGILSTLSVSVAGYPFGSVTPFMLNQQGNLVIYASDIAQHARNMKADAKVSLCVNDATQTDSQANARVTVLGDSWADQVDDSDIQRYFRLFPQAKSYEQAHDFRFYLIKTKRVRYIGGFGEIFWFAAENWLNSFVDISESELGAIEHMHEDHADALAEIAAYALQDKTQQHAKMLSIFHDGFHLDVASSTHFIAFNTPLSEPAELRKAMVDVTKKARAANIPCLTA